METGISLKRYLNVVQTIDLSYRVHGFHSVKTSQFRKLAWKMNGSDNPRTEFL